MKINKSKADKEHKRKKRMEVEKELSAWAE